ncbi:pancreatic progenitor cell differentiation and proliferation factor-like protein [Heterodontus francisci]|uniref:pancreatic progenitor cell differentiation and proliferation factor-like protein n=1 Tax=Heterodontus francisci TaxID=7792 RepID=UPI00355C02AD
MASVPSAGCLLAARQQYYRARLNSSSGVASNGSCCLENVMEHEKSHQGFLLTLEKCWWLKNFLNCETVHHPVNTELSAGSGHR